MKFSKVAFTLLATLAVSVLGTEINLGFSGCIRPQNSFAFASRTSSETAKYISHSGYQSRNVLDSFLVIEGSQRRIDSIAGLVAQKDSLFIESSHTKYVAHFFVFELDTIYKLMGTDSVIKAVLKWKGESIANSKISHRVTVKIPQAGHGWSPHVDTLGDTLRSDAADTNFALAPAWFRKNSFFQHELVIEPIITNITDSITTLRTDFIEVVLFTSGKATFILSPFQNTRNFQNTIIVSKTGKSQINIHYQIANRAAMTLDLISLSGILIKRLEHGTRGPGNYTLLWNGQLMSVPVPQGTYIIKLSDTKSAQTAPVSFVR